MSAGVIDRSASPIAIDQHLDRPRLRLAQRSLQLAEQTLDRVEIRAVRRQVPHLGTGRVD
jgi:hypothetical protein